MNIWEFELIPILQEIIVELQKHHENHVVQECLLTLEVFVLNMYIFLFSLTGNIYTTYETKTIRK